MTSRINSIIQEHVRFSLSYDPKTTLKSHLKIAWSNALIFHVFMFLFCLVFAMSLCASIYMCFVVTCWERADLLALVCGV